MEVTMFNIKGENLVGDTNKLLFLILTELQQLNNNVESLRPVAMDTVIQPIVDKVSEAVKVIVNQKPKKEVVKRVNTGQKRKLSKV